MFDSDDELKAHVRGQVGVSRDNELPAHVLDEELENAKSEINRELKERLNNGDSVNFYAEDDDQQALVYLLLLRAKLTVEESRGQLPDNIGNSPPESISTIRRTDFGEQTLNHWRDRMVTHLNRITD